MTDQDTHQTDDACERDHASEAEAVRRVLEWIISAGRINHRGQRRAVAVARRAVGMAIYLYPEFYGSREATLAEADALGLDRLNRANVKRTIKKHFGVRTSPKPHASVGNKGQR